MEELHRTHKETPIGWFVVVRELAGAVQARRSEAKSERRSAQPLPEAPGDLFNLAAPR